MLGKFLRSLGDSFYVRATREQDSSIQPPNLFKWISDSIENPIHHNASLGSGDCLTLSSEDGELRAAGFDCSRKKKPLCLRMNSESSSSNEAVTKVCEVCSSTGESPQSQHQPHCLDGQAPAV